MIAQPNVPLGPPDLPAAIETIVRKYGAWRVLRAAAAEALRAHRRSRAPRLGDLNAHMRRDIGLQPLPPARRPFWDLR